MYEYYRLYWEEGDGGQTMTFVLLSFWTLKRRGDLMEQIER
jgi:hypothetical protein